MATLALSHQGRGMIGGLKLLEPILLMMAILTIGIRLFLYAGGAEPFLEIQLFKGENRHYFDV